MEINSYIIAKDRSVCDAISLLLSMEKDFRVIGGSKTAKEAIPALDNCCPDVVVWDVASSSASDALLAQQICSASPSARLLILAMNSTPSYMELMIQAGVQGYLFKDQASTQLPSAIRTLAFGQQHLPPHKETDATMVKSAD